MADTETTSPAVELREAAKRIRGDASWPAEDLYHGLADLLDEVADDRHASLPAWVEAGALRIARAYAIGGDREVKPRPRIVCLCGSTRFGEAFREANLRLTLAGEIVLSIGCDTKADGDLAAAGALGRDPDQVKADLDALHRHKIELADYVLVLNVGGYIGTSTRGEIEHARALGKPVEYLEGGTND